MTNIGFSTGALAFGDFRRALALLERTSADAVELSALRIAELHPLAEVAAQLDLGRYPHVSVHAPGSYAGEAEEAVVRLLAEFVERGWPVVVHPDAIIRHERWRGLGEMVLVENMDKRKPIGRTVAELEIVFDRLPDARLCFDIAHARQIDPSMSEAYRILKTFGDRVAQVHVSEVGTASRHGRISLAAQYDFEEVVHLIPPDAPVIIESPVAPSEIEDEIARARRLFEPKAVAA